MFLHRGNVHRGCLPSRFPSMLPSRFPSEFLSWFHSRLCEEFFGSVRYNRSWRVSGPICDVVIAANDFLEEISCNMR